MELEIKEETCYYNMKLNDGNIFYTSKDKAYPAWRNMIERCKNDYYFPKYSDCIICKEWLNYQNFAQWYHKNIYSIEDERMELDKDIIKRGNRLYSPQTCIFVPQRINLFFSHKTENEGIQEFNKRYKACYWDSRQKKNIYSCLFDTSEEALEVYRNAKKKQLELILEEYKDKLPDRVYEAIAKYHF